MKNQLYTIFEDDQVLRAEHLNVLRSYLDDQGRKTRSHLLGVGIVCGLTVENLNANTIRINSGVGITSHGYMVSMPTTDCTHIRQYIDPGVLGTTNDEAEAGIYLPFKEDDAQITLWELLAVGGGAAGPDMYPIDKDEGTTVNEETGEKVKFQDYCVLLYLEMEDQDLEDCFGDDCDENGVQRNLNWRKLLIKKADLEAVIEKRQQKVNWVDEVTASQNLLDPYVERLGYYNDENLSLANYSRFGELANDYRSIIENSAVRVGEALHESYAMFKPLLSDLYSANPFSGFDNQNAADNTLFKQISQQIEFQPEAVQYAYDFLRDLVDAYDEFREVASEVSAVCRPNTELFPRHLMLDYLGSARKPNQRTKFRHYFRPSPILNDHQMLRQQMRHLHQRMVRMVEQFKVDTMEEREVKITPSKTAAEPLSERSIPYYYNVDEVQNLVRLWNYQKMRLNKHNLIPSYHAEHYSEQSEMQTLMRGYGEHSFLRVEGHIGRNYETVLGEIKEKQERLNVPIKVVGVKLSKTFGNTNVSYECRFDDLQELYETFKKELQCLLDEEIQFFRSLELTKKSDEKETVSTSREEGSDYQVINKFASSKPYMMEAFQNMEPYDSPITGERRYPEKTKSNTFGYIYDSFVSKAKEGQSFLDVALNINPELIALNPKIWVYLFLKPAQLANDIQQLQKTLPKRLEDLAMDALQGAYNKVIETAKEYKEQLKESEENKEQLQGKEQIILFRLDKLIYSCSIEKLKELYNIYQDRVQKAKEMNLFKNFARRHSGMEHMGGVPKGGTLVLVYIDRNEESLGEDYQILGPAMLEESEVNNNIERIRRISGRTGIRKRQTFSLSDKREIDQQFNMLFKELQYVSAEKGINIDQKKWAELNQGIKDKLELLPERIPDEQPPDNVVVADFALPYLCKSDCPELSTMVISQFSFSLPKSQFCKKDESKYAFNTHPEGGVVESSGGGVLKEGNSWFFKPSEANLEDEDIQFTYRVNNQTVVYNVKVFDPKANFEFNAQMLDNGVIEVSFINKSTGAQTYEWDFGDGQSSTKEDPVHQYKNYEKDVAVVTLKAAKFDCTDKMIRQVDIPREVEVEFRLKKARLEDEIYILCNNDEPYEFVTRPDGKPILGDNRGVVSSGDTRYLAPQKYKPGSYSLQYQGESMDVQILPVSDVDFSIEYIERGTTFAEVELVNESNGEVVKWTVDDSQTYDEDKPRLTFKNTGFDRKISLEVEFENGCRNTVTRSASIEFAGESDEPDQPDQPDDESSVIDINIDNWLSELENHKDEALDKKWFDGGNPIHEAMNDFLTGMADIFQDEAEKEKYLQGGMNANIASHYKKILAKSFNMTISRAENVIDRATKYFFGYYKIQLKQLLYFVLGQTKDITTDSAIGKVLVTASKQLKKLGTTNLDIDPDGSYGQMISDVRGKAKSQSKTKLFDIVKSIEKQI